jgi:translocation and assembly module TamA
MRAVRLAVTLLLASLLAACGLLTPKPPTQEASAAAPPAVVLEVDAPRELKTLLQNNLDLERLSHLAGSETISEPEIARLVAAAPAQARELLETEGYFEPVIQVQRVPNTDPPRVHLRVLPGPRAHVGKLTFEVEGELERSAAAGNERSKTTIRALREAWHLKPGQPFRNAAWTDAKNAALAQLRAEGYANASWSGTGAEVDVADGSVRVFVVADSGPLFLAGPMVIEGLERQGDADVRNLAGFSEGQPLTDQALLDFQERLQTSGLFDRATVVIDPDPAQAKHARVLVTVHELSLQQATAGVGYSTQAGPRVSLEHWHRRLLGQPITARTKVEWGRDKQALDGDLSTHAKHDFWRNLVGYGLERLKTDTDTVTSARLRVGRSQDTPHLQRFYFVEALNSLRTTVDTREQGSALSLNYHWGWRELDSQILPTDGFALTLQSGVGRAHDQDNRAGGFVRLYGRASAYKPFGDRWYASGRLELGQIMRSNEVTVPDGLRFRAGGDESVRGYSYRSLAPLDANGKLTGGNVLFTSSVELAHPISLKLPSVWWAVFVDAGRAADSFKHLTPAVGVGGGIRWRSPVGPLKVDLAWGNETHKPHLHLSVGIVF